jgi:hypothetical protein
MKPFHSLALLLIGLVATSFFYPTHSTGNTDLDTRAFKFNQSLEIFDSSQDNDTVYQEAIKEGLEAIFLSNLIVLPTQNDGTRSCTSCDLFAQTVDMMDRFISALSVHIIDRRFQGDIAFSRAAAIKARNFIQLCKESLLVVSEATRICNPQSADVDVDCRILNVEDNAGIVLDPLDEVNNTKRHPFQGNREIRSPFFIASPVLDSNPGREMSFTIPQLARGECSVIVKELRGFKVMVKPQRLPIWLEPWFSVRTLNSGNALVWTWEWIPAEFIKTISICNSGGFYHPSECYNTDYPR